MSCKLLRESLEEAATEAGLGLVAVTDQLRLDFEEVRRLEKWQSSGHGADMDYMLKPAELRTDASALASEALTLLSFAIPYVANAREDLIPGRGRVARYALGRDYHRVIRKRLERLRSVLPSSHALFWRPISDSFPLLERAFARQAGLGFVGKNTMLLRHKLGSYFFLGEVLTNLKVVERGAHQPYQGTCGSCSRCLSNCPTKAFPNPYELDARRCISFLTIEKRGAFTDWESSSIGEWVFGCDICQEVCPFNAARSKEDSFEVWKELRGGELQIELGALFELRTEEEFRERFRGSPITRTGREGLLRNALCVIGNTQAEGVFSQIADRAFDDSSAVVRGEAERTAKKLKNQQLEQTYLKVL